MKSILYYVHDPMCSWCWGFTHTLSELLESLPENINVQRILGGLAADTDSPMPLSMQQQIKSSWHRIEDTIPGIKFNFDFWSENIPRRSTYPACRAVLAARQQGLENDLKMTKAIQRAYYQQARNPSDDSVLIELAEEIDLNKDLFVHDLHSSNINQLLLNEISQSRSMYVESYPSLLFSRAGKEYLINIDYNDYRVMYQQIVNLS